MLLLSITASTRAAVHYVDATSTNATPPYTNWATAATNIQDAVNAAVAGDEVVVTNGTYAPISGSGLLAVRSVNGPLFTVIAGDQSNPCVALTNGASLAGFTLTNGSVGVAGGALDDCTLTGNGSGAQGCTLYNCALTGNRWNGAYSCTLSNCVLTRNAGDGADYCTLNRCTLEANSGYGAVSSTLNNCAVSANFYSGASQCSVTNCTLAGNASYYGVGATSSSLNNCIVYFNGSANYDAFCTLNYCCTTPQPTNGLGNISSDPQLASLSHVLASSPCRGAANAAYVSGTDIDGEAWASSPSIGCDEYHADTLTGPLSVTISLSRTNVLVGYATQLAALINGRAAASTWDFGDGTTATNQPVTSHAWAALGDYPVVLRASNDSYPAGMSATVSVHVVSGVHYVSGDSTNPVAPYISWATAATTIQDAINAAEPGASVVVVSNGFYNPISVPSLMTVRSVNGPDVTFIDGHGGSRCANLAADATLSGFTLGNGFASGYGGGAYGGTLNNRTLTGNVVQAPLVEGWVCVSYDPIYHFCRGLARVYSVGDAYGGGAYSCTLNNCTLTRNWARAPLDFNYDYYSLTFSVGNAYGGGAAQCTLNNCTVSGNFAETSFGDFSYGTFDNSGQYGKLAGGGGVYACTLTNCALSSNAADGYIGYIANPYYAFGYDYYVYVPGLGGGALHSTLNNCNLAGNSASDSGGAAYDCTLVNCSLSGNFGSVAYASTLVNSALTGNFGSAAVYSKLTNCTLTGNSGGAASSSALNNCIAYFNAGANYDSSCTLNYCCTTPQTTNGVGNISADPQLASASHLSVFSPCIGKGSHAAVSGLDIDREPWANPPSIGCDEYHVGAVTGPLTLSILASFTNVAVGYPVAFTGLIDGRTELSAWDFGDGTMQFDHPNVVHSWSTPGDYAVSLWAFNESYPDGISATVLVHVVPGLHYVAAVNGNPAAPYASWATAATNLQDAINAVEPGGSVLVSNGVYAPIVVYRPLPLRSVNGPMLTIIDGGRSNLCASLATGVTLAGFTLTNGSAGASGGTLNNCLISGNAGDGASGCTLNNCLVSGNTGTGASGCVLTHCTLTGNSASNGLGVAGCILNDCIVYFNRANCDSSSTFNYCCTTPPPTNGLGNISLDPQLASSSHLSAFSPCRGAANPADAAGTDIDGEAWGNPPSIGCDEYHPGAVTGTLDVGIVASFTNVSGGFRVDFGALIAGRTMGSTWDFGDGVTVTNQPYTSHSWTTPGDYSVELRAFNESHPGGIAATMIVHVLNEVHYVAANSASPLAPYTSWATAATNLQDAVDAAIVPGAQVMVTNGTYAAGGRTVDGYVTNRVAVHQYLTVRSANGPQFTVIDGRQSFRCVYLAANASLSGFTLSNGLVAYSYGGGVFCESSTAVLSNCVVAGNQAPGQSGGGGGVYGGTLNDCTLSGNSAPGQYGGSGGAARYSTLNNCTLTGNSAYIGGGTAYCILNNCTLSANSAGSDGGGAYGGTLNNCTLTGNSAPYEGGASGCTLNNCSLTGNWAYGHSDYGGTGGGNGGGAGDCTLNHCRLVGNWCYAHTGYGNDGGYGGGAVGGRLNNCALTGNSATHGGGASGSILNNCTLTGNSAADAAGAFSGTLNNCIVLDGFSGSTLNYCWTTDPLFVSGSLRLQSNSPCINAGNNSYLTNSYFTNCCDLDGNPRIAGGTVDIGAYESQSPVSQISYAWLQQYGLPIDNSTDTADPDGDAVDNYHEWLAGTNPTNSLSSPAQLTLLASGTNIVVTWSTNAVGFTLQSTTNLLSPAAWVSNSLAPVIIAGQNTVTNSPADAHQFYRLIH